MGSVDRRALLALGAAGVLGLAGCSTAPDSAPPPRSRPASPVPTATPTPTPTPTPTFDRAARSIDEPTSLWVVANKRRPLPDYVPDVVDVPVPHTNAPQLRAEASAAVVALFAAAKADGIQLASNSAYRSYAVQQHVYATDLAQYGRKVADNLAAHPGCSEHQTGLAIDIGALSGRCSLDVCMGDQPEGRWLRKHAWRHGFLLRYPADKVAVTGYQYEPWHFRFLGIPLARELHTTGVATLEEFFGLPAAPTYP